MAQTIHLQGQNLSDVSGELFEQIDQTVSMPQADVRLLDIDETRTAVWYRKQACGF